MVRFAALVVACSVALVAPALRVGRGVPPAVACTGGGVGGLEDLARMPLILLADAVRVGDAVNRAPTATVTSTPTTTPTAAGAVTPPATTPVSPPFASPTPPPYPGVDLTGVGAELSVVRAYAGVAPAHLRIDTRARADLEQRLREIEATRLFSNCTPDRFVARYVVGRRYLVFATEPAHGDIETAALYPVEGDNIVLRDPLLRQSYLGELSMVAKTYRQYFSSLPTYEGSYGLAADRVPLASVLRAVAFLRGDPSIAPPDTGSAGLAAGR